MKRWILWAAAAALLLGTLFSCGEDLSPSPYDGEEFAQDGALLTVEHDRYDKSVESFTYRVENTGEEAVTFNARYVIEVERNGVWQSLPQAEDAGWNDESYSVAPGEARENAFSFLPYRYAVRDGNYRLIKEIGGKRYCAYFTIGSGGAEDASYSYAPLEELDLDAEEIACDLYIDAAGGISEGGEERVGVFLDRVAAGTGDMLRMVTTDADGLAVVYDLLYENGCFLLRRDDRRGGGGIEERRYSFLVTDGETVSLSDRATLDGEAFAGRRISAGRCVVLTRDWFADWEAVTGKVEAMTAQRLSESVTLARFWSEDGGYWVDLTKEGLDYTVSTKGYGMSRSITGLEAEAEIIAVRWESPAQLRLFCAPKGEDGRMGWYAVFDVEQEKVVVQGHALLGAEETGEGF